MDEEDTAVEDLRVSERVTVSRGWLISGMPYVEILNFTAGALVEEGEKTHFPGFS